MSLMHSAGNKNQLQSYCQRENLIVSSVKPAFVSTVGIQGNDAVERADIDHPISHDYLQGPRINVGAPEVRPVADSQGIDYATSILIANDYGSQVSDSIHNCRLPGRKIALVLPEQRTIAHLQSIKGATQKGSDKHDAVSHGEDA